MYIRTRVNKKMLQWRRITSMTQFNVVLYSGLPWVWGFPCMGISIGNGYGMGMGLWL